MTKINFSTLFTTPVNNAAQFQTVNFRGSVLPNAFEYQTLEPNKDRFSTNPLDVNNKNKAEIEQIAKSSPRIMSLLKEYNLPLHINKDVLDDMKISHHYVTRVIAAKIYSALPERMKAEVNLPDLQQAAMLHDYGKVLIPKEILNKEGSLSQKEKEIMELHSEFGYELLKQQGVNERVLNLIKYHHQKPDGSGYPAIDSNFEYNVSAQILKAADMYSALTEERSYHKACTKEEALEIIYKEVEKGTISQEVFDAIKKGL